MDRDERGQVMVLVIGMALVVAAVAGVAVDGTRAFLHRRTLQNAADSAVLAAASQLDRSQVYSTPEGVTLDKGSAERFASQWLSERSVAADVRVATTRREISVLVRGGVPTTFLRLVGVEFLGVAARASARPFP